MHFQGRDLRPYSEPVKSSELKEGLVYFSVGFLDTEMLIPVVEPLVFIGTNRAVGDTDELYFQDAESYRQGVRFEAATDTDRAKFYRQSHDQINHIFEFEHALDLLLACSLRRKRASSTP
jgi:hypothetical protein